MIKHIIIFVVVIVGLFLLAESVQTWEVANNYPYGKLCDVYNNCNWDNINTSGNHYYN